jgi:hypothetical protein
LVFDAKEQDPPFSAIAIWIIQMLSINWSPGIIDAGYAHLRIDQSRDDEDGSLLHKELAATR